MRKKSKKYYPPSGAKQRREAGAKQRCEAGAKQRREAGRSRGEAGARINLILFFFLIETRNPMRKKRKNLKSFI